MKTSISNPANFKVGTEIITIHGTFKVYKIYKNSLLCDVDWKEERVFIQFEMFSNKYFLFSLVEVVEPDTEMIPLENEFANIIEDGVIEEF